MQSLAESKIYNEASEHGVSGAQTEELISVFRKEYKKDPQEFSELLGVLL